VSYQADAVVDDLTVAMKRLRRAMKGVPAESAGFKASHDRLTRSVGLLKLGLDIVSTSIPEK
jgi:hypothetical protein